MDDRLLAPPWLRRQARSPRALVAEAELNTAQKLVTALERAGFETVCVHDGRMALDVAAHLAPTAIVSDVYLPRLSGVALIAELRRRPMLARTPVVGLSGDGADRGPAIAAGFSCVLAKPVVVGALVWTLWRLLDRRRATTPFRGPDRRATSPAGIRPPSADAAGDPDRPC